MKFESETKLCQAFRDFTAAEGSYVVHAETFGYDMVLVDEEDSERIGIEAKNGDAIAALNQCIRKRKIGDVNATAILVPFANQHIRTLCLSQGVGVITPIGGPDKNGDYRFSLSMPATADMIECRSKKAKPLPRHVSNRPAGVPSPKALTPTREKELRLCGIMRKRAGSQFNGLYATAAEVKKCGLVRAFWKPDWIRFAGSVYRPIDPERMPDVDPDFADVASKYALETA
jgi:hypothetical protein